jgi:hypothetical protein
MKIASFFLKDILFMVLFFCVNTMGFSLGIQFRYLMFDQVWNAPMILSWILAILSLIMLVGYLIYYVRSYM